MPSSIPRIILLVVIVSFAHATMAFLTITPEGISSDQLACAYGKGYLDEVFDTTFINSISQRFDYANFSQVLRITGRPAQLVLSVGQQAHYSNPDDLAFDYSLDLYSRPHSIVWLSFTVGMLSCEYLTNFTQKFIALTGSQVGVLTNVISWQILFGSSDACPYFRKFPLLYDLLDAKQPFKPFGGWKSPYYIRDETDLKSDCVLFEFQIVTKIP